jgi:hypothetical protein
MNFWANDRKGPSTFRNLQKWSLGFSKLGKYQNGSWEYETWQ